MNKVFYFNNKKTQEKMKNFQNIFDRVPGAQWVTEAKWVTFRLLSFSPD